MPTTWPPWGWNAAEINALGAFVMRTMNPYDPYTAPLDGWKDRSLFDKKENIWTFRGTPVRVDKAVSIPYLVWYPKENVEKPKPNNPADWVQANETLLVGYVGAGGW